MIGDAFPAVESRGELRPGVAAGGTVALLDGPQIRWLLDRGSVEMAADLRTYPNFLVVDEL